jgi:hypothetical protein
LTATGNWNAIPIDQPNATAESSARKLAVTGRSAGNAGAIMGTLRYSGFEIAAEVVASDSAAVCAVRSSRSGGGGSMPRDAR